MGNTDRHGENWLQRNNVAIPIDHGYPHSHSSGVRPTEAKIKDVGAYPSGAKGFFMRMIARFANDEQGFENLFSVGELRSVKEKLVGLRSMYEAMGMLDYYEQKIIPRLDILIGIKEAR
jgi:hypothetical protein